MCTVVKRKHYGKQQYFKLTILCPRNSYNALEYTIKQKYIHTIYNTSLAVFKCLKEICQNRSHKQTLEQKKQNKGRKLQFPEMFTHIRGHAHTETQHMPHLHTWFNGPLCLHEYMCVFVCLCVFCVHVYSMQSCPIKLCTFCWQWTWQMGHTKPHSRARKDSWVEGSKAWQCCQKNLLDVKSSTGATA